MNEKRNIGAIIVAAGSGSRVGGDIPKQYRSVLGRPMISHSFEVFAAHPAVKSIYVTIGEGQENIAKASLQNIDTTRKFVAGGATRRESVHNALEAMADQAFDLVMIHDAARPFLTAKVINNLISATDTHKGAIPALAVVDSLARGTEIMGDTVDRESLWRIQTPQIFDFQTILSCHRDWDGEIEATDDARMAMANGYDIKLVEGDERLAKFTFASDFEQRREQNDMTTHGTKKPSFRTGTGFDVHKLIAGEELWLCGVKIEHDYGLSGHSDADVALHAITDAILGAVAMGDIGDHFPPTDPKWAGASSDQFVRHALILASEKGYRLGNVDVTIICEAPKIASHKKNMRLRLADILAVDIDNISVKATTTEALGFAGRREGIAAQAVAAVFVNEGN